ncbi:DUF4261 domain-containing protein [Saccharibacillus brassicae]|uniref:DUF4261 domain-containing protein n=1 Tax=Saccharibacillus brassicae TaxID=2583377 RepID=A0A4Y6UTL1_SACBS|nr:DUF4261 domain-containing protein [Saccharibacillus brassicae]QDH19691.1 DUF4261 domain-containing protein [Saccharibacillus brassicae]
MSFFTKWFKKEKSGEEETERGVRDPSGGYREVYAGERSWTAVPEHRPDTRALSRHVLLRTAQPPAFSGVLQMLRVQGIEAEGGLHEGRFIAHYRGMTVTAEYLPAPLPDGEVEENGKYNRLWPEAEQEVSGYAAQLLVELRNAGNGLSGHRFLTQAVAALLASEPNAIAVYSAPLLVSRADYLASTELLKENELPVNLWVFVGLYGSEGGGAAYTHGMADFGSEEFEMLDSRRSGNEIFELTFSVVHYAVARNIRFQGGEEVSFGEQSFRLNRSAGAALQGMTVKIEEA